MVQGSRTKRSRQRPHEPWRIGPRVYRRGRYWWVDLRYLGVGRVVLKNPDAPGWPHRGDRTEFADVAERWKWRYVDLHAVATHQRQSGRPVDDRRSVTLAAEQYIDHRSLTVDANTVRNDNAAIALLKGGVKGDTAISAITTAHIQTHFSSLRRAGYQPSTLHLRRRQTQAFFEWCGRTGADNPARDVEIAEIVKGEARAFTDEELVTLRRFATTLPRGPGDPPWRFWLEVSLGTGARFGELMALEWSAFDRTHKVVRLTQQIDKRGRAVKVLKGKVARTSLVLPEFWRFAPRGGRGRVLTPQVDAGVAYHAAQRWAHRFYELAGVKRTNDGWHVWRHTYARLFLERGGTMDELQRSLGHASIGTTQGTYGHFSADKAAASARGRIYAK